MRTSFISNILRCNVFISFIVKKAVPFMTLEVQRPLTSGSDKIGQDSTPDNVQTNQLIRPISYLKVRVNEKEWP